MSAEELLLEVCAAADRFIASAAANYLDNQAWDDLEALERLVSRVSAEYMQATRGTEAS